MTSDPSADDIHGRDFPAGAVIFEEGDPGSRMYVIRSGEVRILKRVGAREIELARLGPGEAFGEMALLERQPRSATAVVDAPARLLEIDDAAFADLVTRNGEIALRLLRRLSARLRDANRQIRNFLSADEAGRAVEVLRAVSGPPGPDGFRPIPPDVSPERLARRVEATPAEPELWAQLRRARLVREVGGRAELAPAEVVDAFLRYVDLRARWHALASGELAEVPDLAAAGPEGIAAELLEARLPPDPTPAGAGARGGLPEYHALKRRFEPDDSGRSPP
jgi:CRP/FNR family cyclic AMP-dependent transcriptional regulator